MDRESVMTFFTGSSAPSARRSLRAALARRPRAPQASGMESRNARPGSGDERHRLRNRASGPEPTHHRASDPIPNDVHAVPGIKGAERRSAMASGHP